MPNREPETRTISLVDFPLVRRLSEKGTVLNSEMGLTGEVLNPNSTLLSSLLLPQRGLYTLVAKSETQQVVGQFRLRTDEPNAHITYIAPQLEDNVEDTAWLSILDGMAREAGRHGVHALIAEVEESSLLFETMRVANFSVYARQEIWRRAPGQYALQLPPAELTEETESDAMGLYALFCNTVPSLMQPIAAPPPDLQGLVYRKDDRIEGYVAVAEGKQGVYLIPYLHPDIHREAASVLEAAIQYTQRGQKVPIYVCMRRYQDWMRTALSELRFEPWLQQALMVKHITAGVRHPSFAQPRRAKEAARIAPPTTEMVGRYHDEVIKQE